MKKAIVVLALASLPALALADELADALKAWEQRDMARALAGFSTLAEAGNAQAQQMLGEMYGFGDGVAEDPQKARQWLQRAAAAGNQEAAASLRLVEQRGQRRNEIAQVVQHGAAQGLSLAAAGCAAPRFPAASSSRDEIRALAAQVSDYRACYGKFIAGLDTHKLPEEMAVLMSLSELDRARAAHAAALERVASGARAEALQVLADNDAWVQRSKASAMASRYVLELESSQRDLQMDDAIARARAARDARAAGR